MININPNNIKRKENIKTAISQQQLVSELLAEKYSNPPPIQPMPNNKDWDMLSKLIQQCNNNPDLRIDISLPDTTIIHIKTYKNSGLRDIYV